MAEYVVGPSCASRRISGVAATRSFDGGLMVRIEMPARVSTLRVVIAEVPTASAISLSVAPSSL